MITGRSRYHAMAHALFGLLALGNATCPAAEAETNLLGLVTGRATSIDLDFWKVTLPVNELGQTSGVGDAVELEMLEGIAIPPYFDVQPDSITFMAPTDGARTSGSNYPRSELREMDGAGNRYEWLASDGGLLSATLRVDELPVVLDGEAGSRVVIGQIHGPNDELCRLYYNEDGHVYFVDDRAGGEEKETVFKLLAADGSEATIPLGERFSYRIEADAEKLVVTVTFDEVDYTGTDMLSAFWLDKPLYFKAGVYSQVGLKGSDAQTTGMGEAEATFFALSKPEHHIVRQAGELTNADGEDKENEATETEDPQATDSDIYAGCVVVVTTKQLAAGNDYAASKKKAFEMCESVEEEFSSNERAMIDDVVDSYFSDQPL